MNENLEKFQCEICHRYFSYRGHFLNHLKTHKNVNIKLPERFVCQNCGRSFTRKANLQRHIESSCQMNQLHQIIEETIEAKIKERTQKLEEDVANIKKNPQHVNNILQVVCVSNTDNYLDMLTQSWGFDKALQYVKDCALANLSGDVKLIEKIYFGSQQPPIIFLDKKRGNLLFVDENNQKIIDLKGHKLSQILANNLQNTYLKGVNHLINQTLENRRCPNQLLEEYDLQIWNQHIYDLCQYERKKQIVQQLIQNSRGT